ncbi:MAG: amino acid adenylation domain-containing protein, partial [Calditrichaeota bacterium]|nr:amino acid adenylation domain-containing protein [Calditrichota bacterium]
CTVDASITPITRETERPTIGRALANSRFYVLDPKMRPVPPGVPGVLFVSGQNLARGYLGRPDLTAAVFLPDPFSDEPGARMYCTGDLVRWTNGGQLEFLGRVDDQVKVRGFRIELGEIESVLRQHPDLKEAAVVLREHEATGKFLAAYVVPASDSLDKEALRDYLRQRLPDYMVPRVFVQLERLPRTSSGKVNRRALPQPSEEDLGATERSAPKTPVQELLASIWSDVLKVRDVGPEDDFFALGGHSLLATRLASRIRDAFGVELPLREIFEASSLAEMAERIESRRFETNGLKQPPLKRVPRDRDLPLSFAQHRLWFLDQLAPGSTNYNVPSAFRLKGALDVAVLREALERIVERHEILRTSFANRGGDPVQVIHERVDVLVPLVDLTGLPEQDRLPVARVLMRDDALRPFDLERAPLFRVLLIRLDEGDHLILLNMHHTITDGWSMGVLVDELATIYNSLKEGVEPELPELPIQYADYAVWQREWLQGEVLERQVAFWKEVVGENPPVLELPTDRPRPAVQTFRGNSLRQDLDPELTESLRNLSQKQGVTLFMTLLAGFDTLLHRYTGQSHILVGSPIANRTRTETERLIGYFANTIVFGVDFSEVEDFRSLLKQVRENTLQAYAHQDLPFEKLVEAVQPERDLSHSPIFQVAFVFQNTPFEKRELKDLVIEGFPPENPIAKYDLTLYATETDSGILCFWEYNTDLFDQSTIERMMRHYANILSAVARDPKQKISELDFLTEDEKRRLLVEWNETTVPLPEEPTVPRVFSEVVLEQPDAPAVQHHDVVLSYRELDIRSSQLADLLRAKGLQTDEIVGISLPRSVDVAVAMLGILKAGGAFLPVDPTYPEERIRYMLEDSGTRFLLTTRAVSENLPLGRTEAILLEELETSRSSNGQVPIPVSPENLAYVIYTSGSTGKPKGTMLPHRGLVNLARAQRKAFAIHPGSRILQFASLSFDASVWETVMALLNGATLVYADQAELLTGDGVGEVLRREQITTVTLPPSVLAVVPQGEFSDLRTIVTAGERCTLDLVKRWAGGRQFVNAYGPTETTVCASMYEASESDRREPPIGKPIDNFQLYVLDQNWQLLPVGVPGELCVGGVGLARGYLNRPDLTAEKFIPNPFSSRQGDRLYRTGDLVRWLPDGNLEFLGRIDTQVKLRGFRIELGEIEAVLAGHPAVADVAVIVREDIKGQPYLAAYYVPEAGQEPPASEFRSYLRQKLPEYMVPAVYVRLEALPLTPNGKVDRKRLPKPELSRGGLSSEYVPPRTEVERELCAIVAELLGIDQVGVHDNFFELGGHSLLATKFMSRIRERLGVELPLRDLFEKPTVAELAVAIEQQQQGEEGSEDRIERVEREAEDIEALLREIEQLSDEEAEALLRQGFTEGGNRESGL